MIAYDIGVLPLIRELRNAHPRVTHPWYADDTGAGGTFQQIMELFRDLQARGPARGYYPEPTKSILVVAPGSSRRLVPSPVGPESAPVSAGTYLLPRHHQLTMAV